MSGQNLDNDIKVAIARGIHLFPFRTEKLSLVTPMVLRNSGRVGRRRFPSEVLRNNPVAGDFVFYARRENPYLFHAALRHASTQCCRMPSASAD